MNHHDEPTFPDRCRGALVGLVVGDCLAAPYEGYSRPAHASVLATLETSDRQLSHTDDTAQALTLARSLVSTEGRLDPDHLAHLLAATWAAEPHRGYGRGAASLLAAIHQGGDWRALAPAQFGGAGSWGNGAAMRVAPVAIVADTPERAADLGRQQAAVTHTHPDALDGAAVLAVAVNLALHGRWTHPDALDELRAACSSPALRAGIERLASLPPDHTSRDVALRLGNGVDAASSVPAALALARRTPSSPLDAVRGALRIGGDTDTIAAMAAAIVGAHAGIDAVPPGVRARCEGADVANGLARTLSVLGSQGQRSASSI